MSPRRTHIGWGILCGCLGAAILVLELAHPAETRMGSAAILLLSAILCGLAAIYAAAAAVRTYERDGGDADLDDTQPGDDRGGAP